MSEFMVGDEVEFIGGDCAVSEYNPSYGAIGVITASSGDGVFVLVQWPRGSTAAVGGDEWWVPKLFITRASTRIKNVDCEQLDKMFAEFDN